MTTTAIRQRLITYLADADESKVRAVYTLLQHDIEEQNSIKLTSEQKKILEEEKEKHLSGISSSYTRAEAVDIIRNRKAG